ncbi:MAG: hypothetical protein KA807_12980 [Prolixibacteraceae bacterium]|jgi:hypothetical protein|nr:hypothetical protein [Prolixibacteraceae bacterium]
MIIIHPIGDFLTELFPELKGKLSDEKLIVKTISDYYSISNIKPEVKVHNGFVEIQVVFQLVCLGWQVFIEVLHLKITLFYSIFWITKTIQLIVK